MSEVDWQAARDTFLAGLDSGDWEATCAFCGVALGAEAPGSLLLSVESARNDASQAFFVHAQCLASRLHHEIPFDPYMFESDSH